jgi:cob(I)alamin adenosyltransferase
MKIYTKTGDKGDTSLVGGERVSKGSPRIDAYGSVDELNAHLGQIRSSRPDDTLDSILKTVQGLLFILGADLAAPRPTKAQSVPRISMEDVAVLERAIDKLEVGLEPLKSFILPGGAPVAAQIHIARTVCRRAERALVRLAGEEQVGSEPVIFLNRLSDLLFVMARYANARAGVTDIPWISPGANR